MAICRRTSYQQHEITNSFQDAVNIVKKHSEEIGSKVTKLYQYITDDDLDKLKDINKEVNSNVGRYSFDGISKCFMIAFHNGQIS